MDKLIPSYSLEEKIGQMLMIGFRGTEIDSESTVTKQIKTLNPGGIWLTDNDSPLGKTLGNIESPEQVKILTSALQATSKIPLLISIDAEGGKVIRLKEKYGFPATYSAKYLGTKDDLQFTLSESSKIASLLSNLGINLNFTPVVDLELNSENPPLAKKERCFGSDVQTVINHSREVIQAHDKFDVLTVLKHFPGHGSSGTDSHLDMVDVSSSWNEIELLPYKTFIAEGLADVILSAHVKINSLDDKLPATLSKNILTGLLREKMGFTGLIISDDLNMGAIYKNYDYNETIALAINAGVDMLLQGNVLNYDANLPEKTFEAIYNHVKNGVISEERVEDAFSRIIKIKQKVNLL